jgi:NOL1/NOP2/fmu family ribosome biogenesis protein
LSFDWLKDAEREKITGYFVERFGMSENDFSEVELYDKGAEFVNAVAKEVCPYAEELGGEDAGITLVRRGKNGSLKPTTRGVQAFCQSATDHVIDVTIEELRSLVEGRAVSVPVQKGFVLLRLNGVIAGVGLAREGRLLSQLPRNFTQHLVFG